MKRFGLLIGGAVAAAVCIGVSARAQDVLRLEVGGSQVVTTAAPISRIVIDKPGVVTARLKDRRHLELTGAHIGETGLHLALDGKGPGASYVLRVDKVGQAAAHALADTLHAQPGFADVQVDPSGAGLMLTGHVKDVETHARLTRFAGAQGAGPLTDMVTVTGDQMVAVDIRFYAVASNTLKTLGFNFSYLDGAIQGGIIAPGSLQSFSLAPSGLTLNSGTPLQDAFNLLLSKPKNGALGVLSALSDAGLSQVLAQPTLLVRSGESADFLAGGDVPIPVPQGGGANGAITVEYRPYGVRLSVAPVVLSDKRILLKLSPEVSELDYTNAVQVQGTSVPGFRRRSAATTVELGDGQSFVIAGLTYMTGTSNESRFPGLGDLPVIGALFRTSQATRERQELIVVATPRLVSPLDRDPMAGVKPDVGNASVGGWLVDKRTTPAELERLGLSR